VESVALTYIANCHFHQSDDVHKPVCHMSNKLIALYHNARSITRLYFVPYVSLGTSDLQNLMYMYNIPPSSQLKLDTSYEISPY